MNRLEILTASPETCEKLVNLGIEPVSIIWHLFEENEDKEDKIILGAWDTCILNEPVYVPEYKVPAWTKAELDVMLGPSMQKPDLFSREQIGQSKTINSETYPVFFPEKMRSFVNGAEASAVALIWLLEKNLVKVDDANFRYKKVFQIK